MPSNVLQPILIGSVLCLLQLLAALPWLFVVDPRSFRRAAGWPASWLVAAVLVVLGGAAIGGVTMAMEDPDRLAFWGRLFGAVLHLQLVVDFFVFVFGLLLLAWPHGGAVALAAFREGIRQPMFWFFIVGAVAWLVLSPFWQYFT